MKKVFLCLSILPLLIAAKNGDKSSADRKQEFVSSCAKAGDRQFSDTATRIIFHEYCDCAGDRLLNKFTDADWSDVDRLKENHMDSLVALKMTSVIQPCLDELKRKITALDGAKDK